MLHLFFKPLNNTLDVELSHIQPQDDVVLLNSDTTTQRIAKAAAQQADWQLHIVNAENIDLLLSLTEKHAKSHSWL